MKATKLSKAPEGYAYYRVCDPEGICRVVKGALAAQRLVEVMPHLSATKTKLYPVDWSLSSTKPVRQQNQMNCNQQSQTQ